MININENPSNHDRKSQNAAQLYEAELRLGCVASKELVLLMVLALKHGQSKGLNDTLFRLR